MQTGPAPLAPIAPPGHSDATGLDGNIIGSRGSAGSGGSASWRAGVGVGVGVGGLLLVVGLAATLARQRLRCLRLRFTISPHLEPDTSHSMAVNMRCGAPQSHSRLWTVLIGLTEALEAHACQKVIQCQRSICQICQLACSIHSAKNTDSHPRPWAVWDVTCAGGHRIPFPSVALNLNHT